MTTENYVILITPKGEPVLVEVPEKALASALADESRWIRFKDRTESNKGLTILYTIEYHAGRTLEHINDWPEKNIGQTFPLPEDVEVSIKVYVLDDFKEWIDVEKWHKSLIYRDTKSFATLIPSHPGPPAKSEPLERKCDNCNGRGWIVEGEAVSEGEKDKLTRITIGLQEKIDELNERKSDYWVGVRQGYQSALNFIILIRDEDLPF